MEIKELSILFALKEKTILIDHSIVFQIMKNELDDWFTIFNDKYSNSVMSKAKYDSPIRKPYNEKWLEYTSLMEKYRACEYYIEMLS